LFDSVFIYRKYLQEFKAILFRISVLIDYKISEGSEHKTQLLCTNIKYLYLKKDIKDKRSSFKRTGHIRYQTS